MAHVVKANFNSNLTVKNRIYDIQSAENLKQARQNIGQLEIDTRECLPDFSKPLTIREFEILHLASYGFSNPQIAEILSISSHTVKSHFDHIFNKLGVNNRTMAVGWAARHGFFNTNHFEFNDPDV